jgi:hypothetical protein
VPEEMEHPNPHEYTAVVDGQVITGTIDDSMPNNNHQQHHEDGQRRSSSEPTLGTTDTSQTSKRSKSRFGKITKFFKKHVGGSASGGKSFNKGDASGNISSITASMHSGEVAMAAPSSEMLAHESLEFETLLPHPHYISEVKQPQSNEEEKAALKKSSPARLQNQSQAPPKKERKKLWKRGQPKEPPQSNQGGGLEPMDTLMRNTSNMITDSVARMPGQIPLSSNGPNHSGGSVKADYLGYTEDGGVISALALATAYDENDEYALKQENNIPLPLRLYAEVRMQIKNGLCKID